MYIISGVLVVVLLDPFWCLILGWNSKVQSLDLKALAVEILIWYEGDCTGITI